MRSRPAAPGTADSVRPAVALAAGVVVLAASGLFLAPSIWRAPAVVAVGLVVIVLGRNRMFPVVALAAALGAAVGLFSLLEWFSVLAMAVLAPLLAAAIWRLGRHPG